MANRHRAPSCILHSSQEFIDALMWLFSRVWHTITAAKHFHIAIRKRWKTFFGRFKNCSNWFLVVWHHILWTHRIVWLWAFSKCVILLYDDSTFVEYLYECFYVFRLDGLSVSSKNKKDFHNLLDVYLDAVFFSRLRLSWIVPEGHRLELLKPDIAEVGIYLRGCF